MQLDFVIPASPTPEFYSQIAMFRRALDALGGSYRSARVVAVFGGPRITAIPTEWRHRMGRVDVEWADPLEFEARSYSAQADHRYRVLRDDTHVAILCDADTIFLRRFDMALWRIRLRPAIAGVIAHFHFPWRRQGAKAAKLAAEAIREDWEHLSQAVLGRSIPLPYRYTLVHPDRPSPAPFYVNYGLLAGPPRLLKHFFTSYEGIRREVHGLVGNTFSGQIALTMTCAALGLRTEALPMRFNFPNDSTADKLYPHEMRKIVMLHYLRRDVFDRHTIFTSAEAFEQFLELDLTGSNAIFQDYVRKLTGGLYPFADP